jgi:hypothetical protein
MKARSLGVFCLLPLKYEKIHTPEPTSNALIAREMAINLTILNFAGFFNIGCAIKAISKNSEP